MVRVKNNSKGLSKASKKSHGAVQSIKSPNIRKKSIKSVSQTKKNKNENKNVVVPAITNQVSSKKALAENHQKKSKGNDTANNVTKNVTDFEEKFNIKIQDVESAIEGVMQLRSNNPKVKNQLFEDDPFLISLKVNCHKIPTGNQKILRIPLPHSLVTPDDDICLFVPEVPGIGNKEHEKHVEIYENLLATKGVTNIKKIMTVHELKTEYETYEQKLRLVDLYDYFLVSGKISGKIVHKCGKIFYKKRKVPTCVRLQVSNLKEHIDKQLSKAFFHLHVNGDSYFTDFGSSKMEISKIVENFISVVEFLGKEFPGGFANIKGLHISAPRACSIPVYISIGNSNEISQVRVQHKNEYKLKPVKGELTTQLNAEVIVRPSGKVTVIREQKIGKNKKRPRPVNEENINSELENIPRKKSKSEKKQLKKVVSQEKLIDNTSEKQIEFKSVAQNISEKIPNKKSKNKNKKIEIENTNTPVKENYLKLRKHKNVIETGEFVKKTKVKHLNNSIIIEDLSSSIVPTKTNQEKSTFKTKIYVRKGNKKEKNRN